MNKSFYLNNIQLKSELNRCLGCATKPCKQACPLKCDPQQFIQLAKEEKFKEAVESIYKKNPLGKICGLVCPERLCMKACLRSKIDSPIQINKIQATLIEKHPLKEITFPAPFHSEKIAVIGAGPAGVVTAFLLAQNGFKVTLFEKNESIGGALSLIPSFRLSKETIFQEFNLLLKNAPITLKTNTYIKNPKTLLKTGFNAVFITTGEEKLKKLFIKGEKHTISYPSFLSNPKAWEQSKKIAIIGGGNVAFDCAILAKKTGVENVHIFVRRRHCDMRITLKDHLELVENKISIHPLTHPVQIKKEKAKYNLILEKNSYHDNKLEIIKNSLYSENGFDTIVCAIGTETTQVQNTDNIFYAGDIKIGSSSVAEAIADAKQTVQEFIQSLLK